MWVLARLAIHSSLTLVLFIFLFFSSLLWLLYNTLRYFSEKGKEVAVLFSRAALTWTLGLRPYVDQNARFKIQTKKVRSVIHTPDSQQRLASILVFLATQRAVFFGSFRCPHRTTSSSFPCDDLVFILKVCGPSKILNLYRKMDTHYYVCTAQYVVASDTSINPPSRSTKCAGERWR